MHHSLGDKPMDNYCFKVGSGYGYGDAIPLCRYYNIVMVIQHHFIYIDAREVIILTDVTPYIASLLLDNNMMGDGRYAHRKIWRCTSLDRVDALPQ